VDMPKKAKEEKKKNCVKHFQACWLLQRVDSEALAGKYAPPFLTKDSLEAFFRALAYRGSSYS